MRKNPLPLSLTGFARIDRSKPRFITNTEVTVSALSGRIRKARNLATLSQAELARRIGVKRSAVTQWEHPNGTTPSVEHLIQIAMETGTQFEWLATGRGPMRLNESPTSTGADDFRPLVPQSQSLILDPDILHEALTLLL